MTDVHPKLLMPEKSHSCNTFNDLEIIYRWQILIMLVYECCLTGFVF